MSNNPFSLSGRVAVIAGASRGIGAAVAREFARAGAAVGLGARNGSALEALVGELEREGHRAIAVPTDISKPAEARALVERAVQAFGRLDILVNVAAVGPHFGPMETAEEHHWDETFRTNARGAFELSKAALEHLKPGGAIVHVTSTQGITASAQQGVYGMTKAAVESMVRSLASELGPRGIRVNAVAPGLVKTPLTEMILKMPAFVEPHLKATPLGRWGEPEEIARAVLFLASDASSYVNGHTLVVDGGFTLGGVRFDFTP